MSSIANATQLRELIANALYPVSAYQLPAVCAAFGLGPGTKDEAFASKRSYVRGRVANFSFEELLDLARRVVAVHPDHALQEAINRVDEATRRPVTAVTRRHLLKALNEFELSGDDDLLAFLRRFWPIDIMYWTLSSGSMSPMAPFLQQHAVNNNDVSNEEILKQLGLQACSATLLFSFLEALVHPEIRRTDDQLKIVGELNPILVRDGYCLLETHTISGYPTYSVRITNSGSPADEVISETLSVFDEESVHAAWAKALSRRNSDPEAAITSARSLLETVCKHIVEAAGEQSNDKDDLPILYRSVAKVLNLAPDQHTEETFKAILGSCQNVVNSLATLRNRLSDAHGHGPRPVRPSARHAELAVNLAGTMATFLISTWNARSKS